MCSLPPKSHCQPLPGWGHGDFATSHPQLPQLAPAFRNPIAAPSRMTHPSFPSSSGGRSQLQWKGSLQQDLASGEKLCLALLPEDDPSHSPTAALPQCCPGTPGTPMPQSMRWEEPFVFRRPNCSFLQQSSTPNQAPIWGIRDTGFAAGGTVLLPGEQQVTLP